MNKGRLPWEEVEIWKAENRNRNCKTEIEKAEMNKGILSGEEIDIWKTESRNLI